MPGLFSTIKARMRGALNNVRANFSLIPDWYANIRFTLSTIFWKLANEGYKQNACAYACIRLLAESVPEPPCKVYLLNETGEQEDPNHELRQLIRKPNSLQTEFEMMELITIHLNIVGKSYWWKERSNSGKPIALWPLRPDRMAPIYGKGLPPLAGWEYNLDGQMYQLPVEDVLAFNLPDPTDPTGGIVDGLGPLQVLVHEIETDNQANKFIFALIKNYAMPGMLIKTKKSLSKGEAERLKANFKQKYGGMNLGDPAIIDADTDVSPLSFNLRDLEFPMLRSITEARVSAAFRVPAILVGLKAGLDRSTFANMREAREFFAETTLSTFWTRIANQIQADLVPEFDDSGKLFVKFDTTNVRALAGQIKEKSEPFRLAFVAGACTKNEYRQRLNLPARTDGDVFLTPRGMTEVQAVDSQASEPSKMFSDGTKDYTPARLKHIVGLLTK
jgi:HK97 family phage portal protein